MMAVISPNGIQALGWTLVHSIWQVSLVAVLLMGILAFTDKQRSGLRYQLSLGAMFTACLLSLVTFLAYFRSFAAQGPEALPEAAGAFVVPGGEQAEVDIFSGVMAFVHQHLTLIVTLWLLGVLLLSLRFTGGLWYLRRLRKKGRPVDGEWQRRVQLIAARMGLRKAVILAESSLLNVPVMIGWLKPVILVPAGILSAVPPEQLEAILAHELAHIRRNDYLMNILQSLLEIIYFFHPAMWWMSRVVRREREVCCDDAATQTGCSPVTLAFALSEVSEMAEGRERLALAFAGNGEKSLLMRVKRLLGQPERNNPVNILPAAMLVTGLVLCLLIGGAGQAKTADAAAAGTYAGVPADNEAQPVYPQSRVPGTSDTTKTDTLTVRRKKGSTVTVIRNGKGEVERVTVNGRKVPPEEWEDNKEIQDALAMQKLSFPPPPEFPADFTPPPAPEFDYSTMPQLGSIPEPPEAPAMPPVPDSVVQLGHVMQGVGELVGALVGNSLKTNDTIDLPDFEFHFDEGDWSAFEEKMEAWGEKYGKQMEAWAEKNEPKFEEFGRKMELWAEQNEPRMKEFEKRMEQWQKENEPRLREYEQRMEQWEKENEARLKDHERKMEEWEKKHKSRMEEYERKMKEWEKENKPKMDEYQRKMEDYQRKLQRRMQENKDRLKQLPDTVGAGNNKRLQELLNEHRQLLEQRQKLQQQLQKEYLQEQPGPQEMGRRQTAGLYEKA